jgi:hypothetical protein
MSLTGPQSSGLNYMAASESLSKQKKAKNGFTSDFQQHETALSGVGLFLEMSQYASLWT